MFLFCSVSLLGKMEIEMTVTYVTDGVLGGLDLQDFRCVINGVDLVLLLVIPLAVQTL